MIGDFFKLESFFTHFFQQGLFHVIKWLGKIYIYFLRIYKTSGLIPQCVLLLFAIVAEFHDRWRFVNALTTFNYRNKKLTEFVGSAQNFGLFPRVPTPQELILASWAFRLSIRYSSRSLDAEMVASSKPAAASIL